ncbi:hypothetical protein ACK2GQ_03530 [Clostridioides difficile]|nr:putative alanyl-tRNA synthetase domain protein [Clostridioides difficile DA00165]
MEKLYYTNQYIRDFTAEIIEIKEVENKYHVLLDKTAFFLVEEVSLETWEK